MERWTKSGQNILAPEHLNTVREFIAEVGNVVVLHRHYRGGRAPTPLAFDDFAKFEQYVRSSTVPGDAIEVWPFPEADASRIAHGKVPNERGEMPEGGVY